MQSQTFLRKIRGMDSRYKGYATLDAALADKNSSIDPFIIRGSLETLGEIKTVMVPTQVLQSTAANECGKPIAKKPMSQRDCEDSDMEFED